jgi:hypothetical protein
MTLLMAAAVAVAVAAVAAALLLFAIKHLAQIQES